MPRDEVIAYFERYVERFQLPVRTQTRVDSVEPLGEGFRVNASDSQYAAANVVIATGYFQQPKLPPFASALAPSITQLHSSQYRNPPSLPDGAVLVVGSAQSGCQIAEELNLHGRRVFLATGTAGRLPRRYRGQDIIAWLDQMGFFDLTPEQLPPGFSKYDGIPHLSGTRGGHTIDLHQFARDGVTLLGHLRGAEGAKVLLATDLHENLRKVDAFEREVLRAIDEYSAAQGLDAPAEDVPQLHDGFAQSIMAELDLAAAGINTVIWALGYTFDYRLVKLPVRDGDGFPIQSSGVTNFPGLYFVGMPWMPSEKTGALFGVGDVAGLIAARIATRVPGRGVMTRVA
jgi:putative flavoprotein involved in K+ transport